MGELLLRLWNAGRAEGVQLTAEECRQVFAEVTRLRELASDRRVSCRMALDQFEFRRGERRRGWDANFLEDCLRRSAEPADGEGA